MIIKFYDNEEYNYPLLEIKQTDLEKLKEILNKYQKEDTYNFDDFLVLLEEKKIKHKIIIVDFELFF